MEDIKFNPLSTLAFISLSLLVFIRPFISGLAYPIFEFYYETLMILIAIIILIHHRKSGLNLTCDDKLRFIYPIILLILAYLISTIRSVNTYYSLKESTKFLSYVSVFFIASQASDKQKKILIKIIIASAVIISLYAIYQYFFGYQHTLAYLKRTGDDLLSNSSYAKDILIVKRAIGTFPSPNILGSYLIMIFFLPFQLLRPEASERSWKSSIWITIITIALILTKSMSAWLSIIACLIILFSMSRDNFKNKKIIFFASFVLMISIIAFIIINRWERLMNLENSHNSITQRLNYWRTAIAVIKNHLILGVGPGNFQEVFLKYKIGLSTNTRYAHNIFLHQWAETGILGFLGIFYLIFNSFRIISAQAQKRFLYLGLLAFILHNLVDNSYFISDAGFLWWALLGLALF